MVVVAVAEEVAVVVVCGGDCPSFTTKISGGFGAIQAR